MTDFYIPKKTAVDHWYKEPWMLLVLGGPLIVVIAAIITFYLAWHDSDNVRSKDYYRQGLNVDKDIRRDAKASEYKMRANVKIDTDARKVLLHLEGKINLPASLQLNISSYARASEYENIQKITLTQSSSGNYEGIIKIPSPAETANLKLWHVKIEGADWRLTADWHDPLHSPLQVKP
jgi:hypothetical protein